MPINYREAYNLFACNRNIPGVPKHGEGAVIYVRREES